MPELARRLALINSDGKAHPPLPDPDGVETTTYDLRFRVLARTPYHHLLTELGTVDAAEAALADGCDAVFIDTFGDYGIDRIRAITGIPVIGAGESSLAAAAALGSFSIVTVWPRSMEFLYAERLRHCSGGALCAGVHFLSEEDELDRVGRSEGVKARMLRREDDLLDRLTALCQGAVEVDGTSAVLLGCTCMAPVAEALQERCAFPVLDPSRIGLRAAFDAALTSATAARSPAPRGLATELLDAYLGGTESGSYSPEDCEVCLVTQSTGAATE